MEDWLFGSGDVQNEEEMVDFTDRTNRWMTLPEERGLHLSVEDFKTCVDPVLVTMILHQERLLPVSTYNVVMRMFQKGIKRETICEYLTKQLPSTISLQKLTKVLDTCGYTDLSAELILNSFKWNSAYTCISNPSNGSSPSAHQLYYNLKRLVNNAQLNKPRRFLRKMANRCYATMINEIDPHRKQNLADQCIAIIGAETDTIAITFDKTLYRHVLFAQMKRISRETSNTLISDLVYYGRLANAYAIAGDYQMCELILNEAKCKAYITGPCIEFVNLAYIIAYVTLWQFEKTPTPELRSDLLLWGRIGLKCVEEDFVNNKNQWRRNLLLRMVLCLLGLSNTATVIENCPVNESSIQEAKMLLAEFDKYWDGIETRRKMFYYVARARLCELENLHLECLQFLRKAYEFSMKGNFEEIKYISEYFIRVEGSVLSFKSARRNDLIRSGLSEKLTHDNELRRKKVHFHKTFEGPDIGISERQNTYAGKISQMSSSQKARRRFEPVGDSNISPDVPFLDIDIKSETTTGGMQKTNLQCNERYFPSMERSPPSGSSEPGSPIGPVVKVVKINENRADPELKYDARREEGEKEQDIKTLRFPANVRTDGEFITINNSSRLEKENGKHSRFCLDYIGDVFGTNEMNEVSYVSLNSSSILQQIHV